MNEHTTKEAAKRALVKYPFLLDLKAEDAGGLRAYLLIAQQVDWKFLQNGERVSDAVTDTLRYIMLNHPGLTDVLFSPDGLLRRLREAKEELEKERRIQPALGTV